MAIIRRREGEFAPRQSFDPFRMMRDLLEWEGAGAPATFNPSFEVKETKDGYVFKADLPGINEADLEIHLTGNHLSISGKREAEKRDESETYYAYERSYGSFARAFTLPEGVDGDHVQAAMKDGVLTLVVPKKPEVQPKKISLKPSVPATSKS